MRRSYATASVVAVATRRAAAFASARIMDDPPINRIAQIQQGNAQGTLTERATYTLLEILKRLSPAARDCSRRQTPILRQL